MSTIGETLRKERQKRNLDLDQVSRELKIAPRFLEAIESGHFDQLPAGVFAKSFVRQYATLMGLDAEESVAEVRKAMMPDMPAGIPAASSARTSLAPLHEIQLPRVKEWQAVGDRPNWGSSLPALAMVVVVMLVCSGVYAFWQRARRPAPARETTAAVHAAGRQAPAAQVQPVAAAAAQPAPQNAAPVAPAAPAGSEPAAANPAPGLPPEGAAAKPESPPAAQPAASEVSANRTEAGANSLPPATPANPNAEVRLELTAAEPVWVMARVNGKYLFSGTLEPNKPRAIDVNGTLFLRVGNAGGLSVTLNGKPIGPIGPKGQIRDVQFTSGGFQIVAAPKPPSPPPGDGPL
jgi:cytoskeleton protein RodZ